VIVEDDEDNHSSKTVWDECFGIPGGRGGRCTTIKRDIISEFRRSITMLKRGTPPRNVVKIAYNDKWRIGEILGKIIDEDRGDCNDLADKL